MFSFFILFYLILHYSFMLYLITLVCTKEVCYTVFNVVIPFAA